MQWMVISWTPAHPPLKKTDINLHMQIKLSQGVYTLKSGWLFGNGKWVKSNLWIPPGNGLYTVKWAREGPRTLNGHHSTNLIYHILSLHFLPFDIYIHIYMYRHTYTYIFFYVCVCFLLYLEVTIILTTIPSVPIWIQVWSLYLI